MCGFLGESVGLAFLPKECLLEVFTADSYYFIRRGGSAGMGKRNGFSVSRLWMNWESFNDYDDLNNKLSLHDPDFQI